LLQDKSEKESWVSDCGCEEFVQAGFRVLAIGTIDIDLEKLAETLVDLKEHCD